MTDPRFTTEDTGYPAYWEQRPGGPKLYYTLEEVAAIEARTAKRDVDMAEVRADLAHERMVAQHTFNGANRRKEHVCTECGKTFLMYRHGKRKTCSDACALAAVESEALKLEQWKSQLTRITHNERDELKAEIEAAQAHYKYPVGECQCGCGGMTELATRTQRSKGWVVGMPKRYIQFHGVRGERPTPLAPPPPRHCKNCNDQIPGRARNATYCGKPECKKVWREERYGAVVAEAPQEVGLPPCPNCGGGVKKSYRGGYCGKATCKRVWIAKMQGTEVAA